MNNFSLTILGSSGALPAYGRFPTCQYLTIRRHHFLIDCGEGAQVQLALQGINIHRIGHIFISHLHGDHYLGLMGLLFSMHLQRRESTLHLYSHPGLDDILLTQLRHSRSVLNFKIIFHVLHDRHPEVLFEDDWVTVSTIPLSHKIPTTGFLFREKPGSLRLDKEKLNPGMSVQQLVALRRGDDVIENGKIVLRSKDFTLPPREPLAYAFCSDTQPEASVADLVTGVDVLYHEATFMNEDEDKARETRHSTTSDAARIAQRANAKQLIIGHFSARYKDLGPVLEEARKIFPNTTLATEGTTFDLYTGWN
jgi:ribonuclease Z